MALSHTLGQKNMLTLEELLGCLEEVHQQNTSRTASTMAQSITMEQQQVICTLEEF